MGKNISKCFSVGKNLYDAFENLGSQALDKMAPIKQHIGNQSPFMNKDIH